MPYSVSERLRSAIRDSGFNLKEFAAKSGVPYRTLQDYVAGARDPGAENLSKMATHLRVSMDWILTGRVDDADRISESTAEYGNDFVFVPQMAGEISAGGGLVPDNTIDLKIAFRKEWIQRRGDPRAMSLIRVSGDSMEPTLQSGDLALVDHGRNYVDPQGGIYAIAIDSTIMIKRIQVMHPSKRLKVISDNGRYEAIETDPDKLRVNGKVIWFGREIER